jgi:hypothetical protein
MQKFEQIAVRIEPDLRAELQRAADADKRPLAGMIRKLLHDAIAARPPVEVRQ